MENRFDAVVMGGGPGGSTCATVLAKAGRRVLLLDREKFPRYSIGESLLPATVHGICKLLGVKDEVDGAGFTLKRGGTFRWGKRQEPWVFTFEGGKSTNALKFHYAYQVERSRFDNILLENARRHGVTVQEQCAVRDVVTDGDRIDGVRWTDAGNVEHVARASHVVDATGHTGQFHRLVGKRVFSKYFQNVALFGYFRGGKRLPPPNSGNILSCAFEHGWIWYIPISPEITSVGVVLDKRHGQRLTDEGLEASLKFYIDACPLVSEYLSNATRVTEGDFGKIRVRTDYSYSNDKFWRPGLVLIGDAACFVDPVFSSGVHLATYSGLMAARSINASLREPVSEELWFDAFESRYRREYQVFYEFLVSFYDMGQAEGSYFWRAREVLKTEEAANDAFVRLVAGAGSTREDFLRMRNGSGLIYQDIVDAMSEGNFTSWQRLLGGARVLWRAISSSAGQRFMRSMFATSRSFVLRKPEELSGEIGDGVQASPDGLFWVRKRSASVLSRVLEKMRDASGPA